MPGLLVLTPSGSFIVSSEATDEALSSSDTSKNISASSEDISSVIKGFGISSFKLSGKFGLNGVSWWTDDTISLDVSPLGSLGLGVFK